MSKAKGPKGKHNALIRTVFKSHRNSLIQHGERSELHLHLQWTKVKIAKNMVNFGGQTVLPDRSILIGQKY